jgi:hypothetical protein
MSPLKHTLVILSEVAGSRSEAATQSKACPDLAEGDPYSGGAYDGGARRSHRAARLASVQATRVSPCS